MVLVRRINFQILVVKGLIILFVDNILTKYFCYSYYCHWFTGHFVYGELKLFFPAVFVTRFLVITETLKHEIINLFKF